jgi:hypothetical protein
MGRPRKPPGPSRYFGASPQIIRPVAMMHVKFPLSRRNVEDLLAERGIDIRHETVRFSIEAATRNSAPRDIVGPMKLRRFRAFRIFDTGARLA